MKVSLGFGLVFALVGTVACSDNSSKAPAVNKDRVKYDFTVKLDDSKKPSVKLKQLASSINRNKSVSFKNITNIIVGNVPKLSEFTSAHTLQSSVSQSL